MNIYITFIKIIKVSYKIYSSLINYYLYKILYPSINIWYIL